MMQDQLQSHGQSMGHLINGAGTTAWPQVKNELINWIVALYYAQKSISERWVYKYKRQTFNNFRNIFLRLQNV